MTTAPYQSISQPASLLPDVLACVLEFWALSDTWGEYVHPLTQPSFRAASVCRHWRSTALSVPILWRRLRIDYSRLESLAQIVDLVLSRCRANSLELELRNAPTATRPLAADETIIKLLKSSYSITVWFVLQPFDEPTSLLPLFCSEMSRLRTIKLSVHSPRLIFGALDTIMLARCPSLTTLHMGHLHLESIDFQKLPTLQSFSTYRVLTYPTFVSLSRHCPCLTTLDVMSIEAPAYPDSSVTFPQLMHFKHRLGPWASAIHPSSMPNLQSLSIAYVSEAPDQVPGVDFTVLASRLTSLNELSLSLFHGAARAVPLLTHLPHLTTLIISHGTPFQLHDFFTAWVRGDLVVSPKRLENLHLLYCSFGDRAAQSLIDFLTARQIASLMTDGQSMIKHLRIYQAGPMQNYFADVFPKERVNILRGLVAHADINTDDAFEDIS